VASGEGVSDPEPREAVLPGRRLEDEVLRWCVFILLVVLSEMIISKRAAERDRVRKGVAGQYIVIDEKERPGLRQCGVGAR